MAGYLRMYDTDHKRRIRDSRWIVSFEVFLFVGIFCMTYFRIFRHEFYHDFYNSLMPHAMLVLYQEELYHFHFSILHAPAGDMRLTVFELLRLQLKQGFAMVLCLGLEARTVYRLVDDSHWNTITQVIVVGMIFVTLAVRFFQNLRHKQARMLHYMDSRDGHVPVGVHHIVDKGSLEMSPLNRARRLRRRPAPPPRDLGDTNTVEREPLLEPYMGS